MKQIVERCQQGDREAFGQLYSLTYDRLRNMCRHYVSNEATVDDLLHDAYLLIFTKIGSIKDASKAEAWMQRVVQNLALAYDTRTKQQAVVALDSLQEPPAISETQEGNTYSWTQKEQRLHYLGIPLRATWYPVNTNRWAVYTSAQTMLELPLHGTLQKNIFVDGYQLESNELRLSPSLQWSIGVAAGVEYHLSPVIGIYAEPSLQYFFKTGDAIDTYRTAHPATFSVPIGIRITIPMP